MSTNLELCQDVRRECGIAGSGPTSVLNQTGELGRIVGWVKNCYSDLQAEQPNWRWLRGNFTLQTTASDDAYAYSDAAVTDADSSAAITRWSRWWTEEVQIYLTSAGIATRHYLPYTPWDAFRQVWLTGSPNAGYPGEFSIDPQGRLRLGPAPDGIYTVTGEYQKGPQILAADGDTPEMPPRFHQLIVAMAMKRYAGFEAAPEVWTAADAIENGDRGRRGLRLLLQVDQLPEPRFAGPLA